MFQCRGILLLASSLAMKHRTIDSSNYSSEEMAKRRECGVVTKKHRLRPGIYCSNSPGETNSGANPGEVRVSKANFNIGLLNRAFRAQQEIGKVEEDDFSFKMVYFLRLASAVY